MAWAVSRSHGPGVGRGGHAGRGEGRAQHSRGVPARPAPRLVAPEGRWPGGRGPELCMEGFRSHHGGNLSQCLKQPCFWVIKSRAGSHRDPLWAFVRSRVPLPRTLSTAHTRTRSTRDEGMSQAQRFPCRVGSSLGAWVNRTGHLASPGHPEKRWGRSRPTEEGKLLESRHRSWSPLPLGAKTELPVLSWAHLELCSSPRPRTLQSVNQQTLGPIWPAYFYKVLLAHSHAPSLHLWLLLETRQS